MRGEHCHWKIFFDRPTGSSPHARGTLSADAEVDVPTGIIPACAGNTDTPEKFADVGWDHPRMRGEHLIRDFLLKIHEGSSPHARGTRMVSVLAWRM